MPSGPRIRANNVFGTLSSGLTAGATTMNAAGLADLPAVSSAHALIVIDPLRTAGAPELVIVTAHTGSATSATITRGAGGTTARSHLAGVLWLHAPTIEDFIRIVTASTRPSDPYEGQLIYETDTNKFVGFGGTDWAPRDAGGTLGYAQVTASQGSISTTTVDLTGLTVTVTVGTGRRIRVSSQTIMQKATNAGYAITYIFEGGTQLAEDITTLTSIGFATQQATAILTPSAGSHTYKLRAAAENASATMNAAATLPAFILVEDIGAA